MASQPISAPWLVPQPQRMTPARTPWEPTPDARIHVAERDLEALRASARMLSRVLDDCSGEPRRPASGEQSSRIVVTPAGCEPEPRVGDVVLRLDAAHLDGRAEAWSARSEGVLTVVATDRAGAYYAVRRLTQHLERRSALDIDLVDWPAYPERGVLLDIARKHFPVEWIEGLIEEMGSLGLNTLQLHISDGLGFRVASAAHPEVASDPHLTAQDVKRLIRHAAAHHVSIVPDVDTPAHMDHLLRSHPEWQLRLADGTVIPGHMDLADPAARRFVEEIVAEMADLFEATSMHLGGDEYLPAPWEGTGPGTVTTHSAPHLAQWATKRLGESASAADALLVHLADLADMLRDRGIRARVWNDEVDPARHPRLAAETTVHVWVRWNESLPSATDISRGGHPLVNANGDYLYFILTEDGLGTGPTKHPRAIYEKWTPRTFMGAAGNGGDHLLPSDSGADLRGAHMSIWCDHPAAMDTDEIAEALTPWLRAFAQKVWDSPLGADYDEFEGAARSGTRQATTVLFDE